MKRLLAILSLAAALLAPAAANATWWQTDWSYRKQVTIDTTPKGANISQSVGRIPVLVRLHSGNFSFSDAANDGTDIRFVEADDKTPLAFHVESFDPLLGIATVWVDVTNLPAGSAQNIWLYYGNKKATPGADAPGTFDADYALVYHFEDAAGSPPKDTTAFANNATSGAITPDQSAIIGKGARFAGTGAIVIPPSASLATTAGGAFTFSAWVKPAGPQARAALYARHDTTGSLVIGLDNGVLFADVQGVATQHVAATTPLIPGKWSHVAVTVDAQNATLYVNGQPAGTAPAAMPALNSPTAIGGDVPGTQGSNLVSYAGEMDELRISKTARSPAYIAAEVASESPDGKLVSYGVDEKQSGIGFGYFGIIVEHVTLDAWVVISILGLMAVISWFVMWSKAGYLSSVERGNDLFLDHYRKEGGDPLGFEEAMAAHPRSRRRLEASSLYRIFRAGTDELRHRADRSGNVVIDAQAGEVIRAVMDSTLVRENQKLARSMVLLTIAISGGPFLGLLGTVVGVMITFAAIAATGDVNINAIAPGISAALLATVAGLAVAIPSLFGYNYLLTRSKNISANMQVFVDEFVTRVSELYRGSRMARAAE